MTPKKDDDDLPFLRLQFGSQSCYSSFNLSPFSFYAIGLLHRFKFILRQKFQDWVVLSAPE